MAGAIARLVGAESRVRLRGSARRGATVNTRCSQTRTGAVCAASYSVCAGGRAWRGVTTGYQWLSVQRAADGGRLSPVRSVGGVRWCVVEARAHRMGTAGALGGPTERIEVLCNVRFHRVGHCRPCAQRPRPRHLTLVVQPAVRTRVPRCSWRRRSLRWGGSGEGGKSPLEFTQHAGLEQRAMYLAVRLWWAPQNRGSSSPASRPRPADQGNQAARACGCIATSHASHPHR